MDVGRCFNQVLEVGAGEKVTQVDELTMRWVLHINATPSVLPSNHLLAPNGNGLFGSNNGKWDPLTDLLIHPHLLWISILTLLIHKGEEPDVVIF